MRNPQQAIHEIMAQIAQIPIAQNPQNVYPTYEQIRLYKRIMAIIEYKIASLQENMNAQQGGRRVRKNKTRKGRK